MQPIVSVLMPVYNSEKYLEHAINSILCQSLKNFELLAIYDPSNDDSLEILKYYERIDSRVVVMRNESSRSLVSALNYGMSKAKGKYWARMDSDDISHPERFRMQVDALSLGADIVGSHFLVINEEGLTIDAKLSPSSEEAISMYLMSTVPFPHGGIMLNPDFFRKNNLKYGGVDYAEDYFLWVQALNHGAKFQNCEEFLFSYREVGGSVSKLKRRETRSDAAIARRLLFENSSRLFINSCHKLLLRYNQLTLDEKKFLLLGNFFYFKFKWNSLLFKVLQKSPYSLILTSVYFFFIM